MEREIDLKEISDGRFYDLNDMVKAGCDDCRGCCDCCKGMGKSVVLDPYDVFRLEEGLGQSFQEYVTGVRFNAACRRIADAIEWRFGLRADRPEEF